jgi:competence protein ComEC
MRREAEMRSPAILIAGAFLSGVCSAAALSPFPAGAEYVFLASGVVCSLLSLPAMKQEKAFMVFLAAGVFFFGALRWEWHYAGVKGDISDHVSTRGEPVLVEGVVSGFPAESGGKISFCLDTVKILRGTKESAATGKIMVRRFWREGEIVEPGDVVTVGGKLGKAEGVRNPAGFDWRGYLSKKR